MFLVRSWSHSCLQMCLITPSVPSQLSQSEFMTEKPAKNVKREIQRDIRAREESICVFARTCFAMSSYSISMGHSGPRGPHTRLMHSDPSHWYGQRRGTHHTWTQQIYIICICITCLKSCSEIEKYYSFIIITLLIISQEVSLFAQNNRWQDDN